MDRGEGCVCVEVWLLTTGFWREYLCLLHNYNDEEWNKKVDR